MAAIPSRQEFVGELVHDIDGWLMDAAYSGRHGQLLSVWLRTVRGDIHRKVSAHYAQLTEQTKPVATSAAGKPEAKGTS